MSPRILKNKPLVEAILEVKWQLATEPTAPPIDPSYRLFFGRFYDRVRNEYPAYEALEAASIPDVMAAFVAQYRFRLKENGWPLIQIGPGMLTLNDTDSYEWPDFEKRAHWVLERLFESYPGRLQIQSLLLRYIDAVEVDFSKEVVTAFLRDKLKITLTYPESLFQSGHVEQAPTALVLQSAFHSTTPRGTVQLKFAKGKVREKEALVWETSISSGGRDLPPLPQDFPAWLSAAHAITDDWFFKLIEGELLHRFE
jgi:uncharacterized protein (TIGR04255 family)